MNKRNQGTEQYRTGRTKPPKSYGGLIAFLLILVIFLGGIVSILSMMNIQLFKILQDQNQQNIPMLSRSANDVAPAMEKGISQSVLGFTGQQITDFYEQYYEIPQGIYITDVEEGSDCQLKGLQVGDILTHFNGKRITDSSEFNELLQLTKPGDSAVITIDRSGEEMQLTVILQE